MIRGEMRRGMDVFEEGGREKTEENDSGEEKKRHTSSLDKPTSLQNSTIVAKSSTSPITFGTPIMSMFH